MTKNRSGLIHALSPQPDNNLCRKFHVGKLESTTSAYRSPLNWSLTNIATNLPSNMATKLPSKMATKLASNTSKSFCPRPLLGPSHSTPATTIRNKVKPMAHKVPTPATASCTSTQNSSIVLNQSTDSLICSVMSPAPKGNVVKMTVDKSRMPSSTATDTSTPKPSAVSTKPQFLNCSAISVVSPFKPDSDVMRRTAGGAGNSFESGELFDQSSTTLCNLSLDGLSSLPSYQASTPHSDSTLKNVGTFKGAANIRPPGRSDTSKSNSSSLLEGVTRISAAPSRKIALRKPGDTSSSDSGDSGSSKLKRKRAPIVFDLSDSVGPARKKRKTDVSAGVEPVVMFNPHTMLQNKPLPARPDLGGQSPFCRLGKKRSKMPHQLRLKRHHHASAEPSTPPTDAVYLGGSKKFADNLLVTIGSASNRTIVTSIPLPKTVPQPNSNPPDSSRVTQNIETIQLDDSMEVERDGKPPKPPTEQKLVSSKLTAEERKIFEKTIEVVDDTDSDSSDVICLDIAEDPVVSAEPAAPDRSTASECDVIFVVEKKKEKEKEDKKRDAAAAAEQHRALMQAHHCALLESERVDRLLEKYAKGDAVAATSKQLPKLASTKKPKESTPLYCPLPSSQQASTLERFSGLKTRDTLHQYVWGGAGASRLPAVAHTSSAAPSISLVLRQQEAASLCSSPGSSYFGGNFYNPSSVPRQTSGLRPIIIDGSNVAMSHGNNQVFSCKGLEICINYFLKKGHKVHAFVPLFRRAARDTIDSHILDRLENNRTLFFTPSRYNLDGQREVPYDDRFIVQYAAEKGGVIVSRDNYRDLVQENPKFAETINNRLLMYMWVEDMLMFPQDPRGRFGPNLDTLLRF